MIPSMTTPCPDAEALCAYQAGALSASEREEIERHGAACLLCRETLVVLGTRPKTLAPVRRGYWRAAAAAGLLAATGASLVAWVHARKPPSSPAGPELRAFDVSGAASGPGFPAGPLTAGEAPCSYAIPGADLLLDAGSRIVCERSGRALRAESGRFWLQVSRGEAVTLAVPQATLTLRNGTISASVPATVKTAWGWLVGEADAEETPRTEIRVLEGEADLTWANRTLHPKAGAKLLLDAQGWVEVPMPPADIQRLWEERTAAAAALPGNALFQPGLVLGPADPKAQATAGVPSVYRWVTVLKDRGASTELTFTLPVEGVWYDWTAGLGARPAHSREVIELRWDGQFLSARLDSRTLFSVDRDRLGKDLVPTHRTSWGLSAWGGSVTLDRSILQR